MAGKNRVQAVDAAKRRAKIIALINQNGGSMTRSEISTAMGIPPSGASSTLKRMLNAGLIKREGGGARNWKYVTTGKTQLAGNGADNDEDTAPASAASKADRISLEYILKIGGKRLQLTDVEAARVVSLLTQRVRA